MLGNTDAAANVAVKDLAVGKRSYEETLGLTPIGGDGQEVISFKRGNSTLNVYRSQYAGTNQATAVIRAVGANLDDTVRSLKAKGVAFEHYDVPEMTREGDVHVAGDLRVAWFKDPDGNILNLVNQ